MSELLHFSEVILNLKWKNWNLCNLILCKHSSSMYNFKDIKLKTNICIRTKSTYSKNALHFSTYLGTITTKNYFIITCSWTRQKISNYQICGSNTLKSKVKNRNWLINIHISCFVQPNLENLKVQKNCRYL